MSPHGLQHASLLCPSLSPRVCSNSCPLNQWWYLIFFCLQSFPASGSFPVSQFFTSGGQSIGASASLSVLPWRTGFWVDFLEDWMVWSTCNQKDSQESSIVRQFKSINLGALNLLYGPTLIFIHDNWKNHSFNYMDFVSKVMTLLYNMLSRFVIAFLPRSMRDIVLYVFKKKNLLQRWAE